MIIDVTGIELTPGNWGEDCLGNGKHYDETGKLIECCCDECDYMMCCVYECDCQNCNDKRCDRRSAFLPELFP